MGGKRAARPAPRRRAGDDIAPLTIEAEVSRGRESVQGPVPAAEPTSIAALIAHNEVARSTDRTPRPTRAPEPPSPRAMRAVDGTRFEDSTVNLPVVPDAPRSTTYDVRGFDAERSASVVGGRRRAVREPRRGVGVPGSGLRIPVRPSMPLVAGVAVLAISAGGAVTASGSGPLADSAEDIYHVGASSALSGNSVSTSGDLLTERERAVSRDSERDALEDSADDAELAETDALAEKRSTAIDTLKADAEEQAAIVAANAWVLPVDSYRLTNRFGDARSYYSSGYHTGLDFAAPSGTPIRAVAGGTVTDAGSSGAYGNRTVITLEDGTEMWYAHQSSISVSVGDVVAAGDQIGYVGSTGNSTGPHLHLEVRPGAGDPVDPFRAMQVNGITP